MDPIKAGGRRPPPIDVENLVPLANKPMVQDERVEPPAIFHANEAQQAILDRFRDAVHEENEARTKTLLDLVYSVKKLSCDEYNEMRDSLFLMDTQLSIDFLDVFVQVTDEEDRTIHSFVSEHLNPYLTGEITAENEDKERASLITNLFPIFQKRHPRSIFFPNEVENMALHAYLYQAASHLNRQFGMMGLQGVGPQGKVTRHFELIDPALSPRFALPRSIFFRSLEHAMQIDFPEKKLTREEIMEKADETLRAIIAEAKYIAPIAACKETAQ